MQTRTDPFTAVLMRVLPKEKAETILTAARTCTELSEKELCERNVKISNELEGRLEGYNCPECKNKGYVYRVRESEDAWGKKIYSEVACRCRCMEIREELFRIEKSGLKKQLERCTFENYKARELWQKQIYTEARTYARSPEGWFYIGGQPGCGKTHICTAIVGELIKRGTAAKYIQWSDEITRLKQAVNDAQAFEGIISPIKQASVLYIDDFFKVAGSGSLTAADINMTFRILNHRYNENLPTIISSELSPQQVLKLDEALGSRILEMTGGKEIFIKGDVSKNWRLGR